MDPASAAFGVVALFKDTYLTVQFIKNVAQTIRQHEEEYTDLLLDFEVQIFRFKNLSRLFRRTDGNVIDTDILDAVHKQHPNYLGLVEGVLKKLRGILSEYTILAAAVDRSYQKHSPLSLMFDRTRLKGTLLIDDAPEPPAEEPAVSEQSIPPAQKRSSGGTSSIGSWFSFSGNKTSEKKGSKTPKGLTKSGSSAVVFSPGIEWWFTKDKLGMTLDELKSWNQNLEHIVGPLISGFGFYDDKKLQKRLVADGDVNIFEGHIELSNLSDAFDGSPESSKVIPWDDAQAKIPTPDQESLILVEAKELPSKTAAPRQNSNGSSSRTGAKYVRDLYGHQLARLLTAAGKKGVNFNTLQLSSYAFDSEKAQYVFLFDYPAGTLPKKPVSLHDCIDGGVKLDLKERFRVAQALVRSIGAFHAVGWLHKGIRSHSIKFFYPKDGSACDFNRPYLTDFGFSRPVHVSTRFHAQAVGDPDYEVYRHPERYDPPVAGFTQVHDIYSVGVILLEIGLWQTARHLFDEVIKFDLGGKIPETGRLATTIQTAFLEEARDRLGHRMGSSYRDAVLSCLGGELEDFIGNRDFANEFQKRVVEKVDFQLKKD